MKTNPNCKINLGLHVVRRRDDGYHDIESLFLPIPLSDELEIVKADNFTFQQDGIILDCNMDDNVVLRAYHMLRESYGNSVSNVSIRLKKNIPFGAGLGGGSSDAAFTLKMLNDLFNLDISLADLRAMASRIGADCTFFIDNKPSFVSGIGDQLSPLDFNPIDGFRLILVKPSEAVSTADAYRGITTRQQSGIVAPMPLTEAVKQPINDWHRLVVNDFEATVFKTHPRLKAIKESLYDAGALYAAMSGSGATIFGLFASDSNMEHLAKTFRNHGQIFIY
ncbi:MAG: 4-(cytidine 5'-diphospho)-2-C-methyl-D-erythritol kinase [Bacteroidales bacterium]|nr:4-(cytidine 5'-diphospho)-2-C-methyl-D-erythritol kinase [Bacteroidales bacterium]